MENTSKIPQDILFGFHQALVQCCIDYISKHKLHDIEEVSFKADSLQDSVNFGSWHPSTDSSLIAYGYIKNNENKPLEPLKLVKIGESF